MPNRTTHSFRARSAALICALVAAAVVTFGGVAHYEIRQTLIDSATQRLQVLTRQVATLLDAQAASLRAQMVTVAERPDMRRALASGGRDTAGAMAVLRPAGAQPGLGIELWDTAGRVIIGTGALRPVLSPTNAHALIALLDGTTPAATGPIRLVGDSAAYPVIARVDDNGQLVGYAVHWRRVMSSGDQRKQLSDLVGSAAVFNIGDSDGSLWTDMVLPVARPPGPLDTTGKVMRYTRSDRGAFLAAAVPYAHTPWTLLIEFPMSAVLAPMRATLLRLGFTGAVLLLIGALSGWITSGTLLRPIADLSQAAGAIREGDLTRRVPVRRHDELGALADSFNQMAETLLATRQRVEADAQELTRRADDLSRQAEATSHALAENARIAAELDAALGSAPVGFAFYDLGLRFVRVNERMAALDGRPPAEHVGLRTRDVLPALADEIETHLRHVVETRAAVTDFEISGESPVRPGTTAHWLASYYPVSTREGDLLGVGSVVRDMTGYKELELQYRHAQKMEAVGRLAGGVAHDFNNILTAIFSFSEFALSELPPDSSVRDDIEQVKLAATRATTLNRKLLAFSRQQVLQPRVIDLNSVVREIEPMLRRLIGEDVEVQCTLAESLWAVHADPGQIEQIIMNLVVNARDAMPRGGTVVIGTSMTELDDEYVQHAHPDAKAGPHVVLSVSDNGVGMDAATRARIFEPFFTTKEAGKGTGLGLATVYGVVKQSGGSIFVYSEPGHGTTFKVYLPRHSGVEATVTAEHQAVRASTDKALVLLVEDELPVRKVARRILERMGHTVLEAVDGQMALDVVAQTPTPINLVITDLIMPNMGGRELVERLRGGGHPARFLFMSGYTIDTVTRRSLLEPNDAFLEKPFTPEDLARKVHELLVA